VACHAVRLSGAPLERSAAAFGADPIRVVATAALTVVGVARQPVVEPAEGREGEAPVAGPDAGGDPRKPMCSSPSGT
jgi:hypothetical protein